MGLLQHEISTYQRITSHTSGSIRLRGPRRIVQSSQDLCNALLHPNPAERLGCKEDVEEFQVPPRHGPPRSL